MMKKGLTLIETLVGIFLMAVIFSGIFGGWQLTLKMIKQSKNRVLALALATSEVEKARNLAYADLGVVGSFPSGLLAASNQLNQNNIDFTISRRVDYVVDPLDGLALPQDECPQDYKRLQIEVSWPGAAWPVELTTDLSPRSLAEECSAQGGILQVFVLNALGQPITLPLIEVKDPATNQTIKSSQPESGNHYFSLAAATAYQVAVSKPGFSSERTYGLDEVATPQNPHPLVLEGELTPLTLSIDELASFQVETLALVNQGEEFPLSSTNFNLRGEKIIGQNWQELEVYKYSQNLQTDGNGQKTVSNLEWDNYTFSVNPATGLDLAASQPPQPISLGPTENLVVKLYLEADHSLLIDLQDEVTLEPIFAGSLRLTNSQLNYDQTGQTDQTGRALFIPLQTATYNLEAQAPGYASLNIQVNVSGDQNQIVRLERLE